MPKKRYFKFDKTKLDKLYDDFMLNSNHNKNTVEIQEVTETRKQEYPKFAGFSY